MSLLFNKVTASANRSLPVEVWVRSAVAFLEGAAGLSVLAEVSLLRTVSVRFSGVLGPSTSGEASGPGER